uniref:7TM_GPCR_Srx domain-containing protein n=1 Tax=Panagrellus redivivus TaxID=6233 RepID=A0A7E4VB67_PANRE
MTFAYVVMFGILDFFRFCYQFIDRTSVGWTEYQCIGYMAYMTRLVRCFLASILCHCDARVIANSICLAGYHLDAFSAAHFQQVIVDSNLQSADPAHSAPMLSDVDDGNAADGTASPSFDDTQGYAVLAQGMPVAMANFSGKVISAAISNGLSTTTETTELVEGENGEATVISAVLGMLF